MNIDWDLITKIVPVISVIIGGLYVAWKYWIERKERLLDKDFEKVDKLLTDESFKRKMRKNHLLRAVYYRNINYFNGIKNEVIDVVIKTQNRKRNFNNNFYDINRFYKKKLLIINNNQDGFLANIEKDKKFRYQPSFVRLMWFLYIVFLLLAVIFFVIVLKNLSFLVFYSIMLPIMFLIQFPLMDRQQLISDWKKFKKNSKHLLDNANELP